MDTRPLVTTIIPVYNSAQTIGRAVESVLAQTCPSQEIFVIDDGSKDAIETALEPYADRVVLVRKPNGGAASARNLGIDRSSGQFVALLDADDWWEPDRLRRQVAVMKQYPDVGLAASSYYNQLPGTARASIPDWQTALCDRPLKAHGLELFEAAMQVMTSTVLIRREHLGSYRFESGLEPAEDRDLWIRMARDHSLWIDSSPLVTVVLEPGSLSRSDPDKGYSPMITVLRRYASLLSARELANLEAQVYRGWAGAHLGSGRPAAALRPAIRRLRRQPGSIEGWWVFLKSTFLSLRGGISLSGGRGPAAALRPES
jgi:glycosyltransferase involved in cell wall biosynthesis